MFFCVDGGRPRISDIASQGARHRRFFMLMVGALGSPAPLPRGPTVDIFYIDGGCSWISVIASQGPPHARFFLPCDILQLSGRRS
jgi:hypothetical protein